MVLGPVWMFFFSSIPVTLLQAGSPFVAHASKVVADVLGFVAFGAVKLGIVNRVGYVVFPPCRRSCGFIVAMGHGILALDSTLHNELAGADHGDRWAGWVATRDRVSL